MPRGKKNVPVTEDTLESKPVRKTGRPRKVAVSETPAAEKPARKPYPTHDERISLADRQIERLSLLNANREALIKKTEEKLAQRKAALEKSALALEKVVAKKARVIEQKEKSLLSGAEKAAAKQAAKLEEKLKMSKLMDALKASGKSLDELLEDLTGKDE